ncbi:hypothetical protein HT031_006865 [Scenedesmus sp. PABB004]|nr:hypothetical protein HT031_006865 [Scenedesmus sp. PABB004]
MLLGARPGHAGGAAAAPRGAGERRSRPRCCCAGAGVSGGNSGRTWEELRALLRTRPPAAHPALLSAAIGASGDWRQAGELFCEHSAAFNARHAAALLTALPRVLPRALPRAEAAPLSLLLGDACLLAEELLPGAGPRELVAIACGLAGLARRRAPAYPHARRLLQLLLARADLRSLAPGELAGLAWAVAALGHDVPEGWVDALLDASGRAMDGGGCGPRELALLSWALATLTRACLLAAAPPLRTRCTRVAPAWKAAWRRAAAGGLPRWGAADVAMGLWGLAVLGCGEAEAAWLEAALARGAGLAAAGAMQGRHVAMVLWATSQLARQRAAAAQAAQAAQLQRSHPQRVRALDAAVASWAADSAGVQALADAALPRLEGLAAREPRPLTLACVALLACARLGLRPQPGAVDALLAAAGAQLDAFAAAAAAEARGTEGGGEEQARGLGAPQRGGGDVALADVALLLHSLVRLGYRPRAAFMAAAARAAGAACWLQGVAAARGAARGQPVAARALRGQELAALLWSMARLRYAPSARLLRLARGAAVAQRARLSAGDVGLLLRALGALRHAPHYGWVSGMVAHFLARADDSLAPGADVAAVVHSLPRLAPANLRRPLAAALGPLLPRLAEASAAALPACGPAELVQLAQGFARLGYRPGGGWLAAHGRACEALGAGAFREREPAALAAAHAALEALPEAPAAWPAAPQCEQRRPAPAAPLLLAAAV